MIPILLLMILSACASDGGSRDSDPPQISSDDDSAGSDDDFSVNSGTCFWNCRDADAAAGSASSHCREQVPSDAQCYSMASENCDGVVEILVFDADCTGCQDPSCIPEWFGTSR